VGSRLFSSTYISSASAAWASFGTAHTEIALIAPATLPTGAGIFATILNMFSATSARVCRLHLDGNTGTGSLGIKVGSATNMLPTTLIIPSTDGRWHLVGHTKAAGTVTPDFFMYDFGTGLWAEFPGTGTIANRTAGAVTASIGHSNTGNLFDGRIGAVAAYNRRMEKGEWRTLINGRRSWYAALGRAAGGSINREFLCDLTDLGRLRDNAEGEAILMSAGSQPALTATSTPPGW